MSHRPKCPNHTVEMDPTDNPRYWVCPVSSARFEVEVDLESEETKLDLWGNPMTTFKITPLGEE